MEGINLKQTLEVLFVGLFRSNLFMMPADKGDIKYSGWFIEPAKLWSHRKGVLNDMANYFKEVDQDPKQFIRVSAPFEKDLFTLGLRQEPPDPDIIYAVESQNRFRRVNGEASPTHWLEQNEGVNRVIEIDKHEPNDEASLYIQE